MKRTYRWNKNILRGIAAAMTVVTLAVNIDMTAFAVNTVSGNNMDTTEMGITTVSGDLPEEPTVQNNAADPDASGQALQVQSAEPASESITVGDVNYVKTDYKMKVKVTVNYNDDNTSVKELRPTDPEQLFLVHAGTLSDSQGELLKAGTDGDYTISAAASGGKVDYTLTLPVFIQEGTDKITAESRYLLPDKFYTIQLNPDTDLWKGHIPGTGVQYVSYEKDANDPVWTAQNMTFTCQKKELKDAVFYLTWIDEDPSNRVLSDEYHLWESSDDGEKQEVTTEGLSPVIDRNYGANTWKITYKNLPGSADYFFQQKTDDYVTDCAPGTTNYIAENGTAYNIAGEKFTFKIVWNDAGEKAAACRPNLTGSLKVYGENAAEATTDSLIFTQISSENGTDTYVIQGDTLPAYDKNGTKLNYYVKLEPEAGLTTTEGGQTFQVKPGFTPKTLTKTEEAINLHYSYVYDNKPNSTSITQCIDGGSIVATLKADTSYRMTKEWSYQEDDASAKENYQKLKDKVTLYLWRYSENKPGSVSAVTGEAGKQYSYTFTMTEGKILNLTEESFGIPKGGLEAYDELGYRYVYFAKEVLPADSGYRQEVFEGGNSKQSSETLPEAEKTYVMTGETLKNIPTEKKSVTAKVDWRSGEKTDYTNASVDLVLQRSEDGDTWEDVQEKTVEGFTVLNRSRETVFQDVESYTTDGKKYRFRVVEKSVSYNGTESTVAQDGSSVQMNGSSYLVTSSYDTQTEKYNVVNTLSGTCKMTVKVTWTGNWKEDKPGVTLWIRQRSTGSNTEQTILSITAGENGENAEVRATNGFASAKLTQNGTEVPITAEKMNIAQTNWQFEEITLPAYDENGNRYLYSVSEDRISDAENYITGEDGNYYTGIGYNVDQNNNTVATVNNTTTKSGRSIPFSFHKEWNAGNSYGLMKETVYDVLAIKIENYGTENATYTVVADLAETNENLYRATLNTANNWQVYHWPAYDSAIRELKDACGEDEAAYYGTVDEKDTAITGKTVYTWGVIEKSVGGRDSDSYTAMMKSLLAGRRVDWSDVCKGTVTAYKDSAGKLWPSYTYEVQNTAESLGKTTYFTITNSLAGYTTIAVEKTWLDNYNKTGSRQDGLYVELYRDDEKVAAKYWFTKEGDTYTDLLFETDDKNERLALYRPDGTTYDYSVREYLMQGTTGPEESGQKYCTIDGQNYVLTEVLQKDNDALNDYYVCEETRPGEKQTEELQETDLISKQYICLKNTLKGKTKEAKFYISWRDLDVRNSRPDPSFVLYRAIEDETGVVHYEKYEESYVNYVTGENPFYQTAVFTGLEKYDEQGKEYRYFVSVELVNSPLTYETAYYDSAATADAVRVNAEISGKEYPITKINSQQKNEIILEGDPDAGTAVCGIGENGMIDLHISEYVNVRGRKNWVNVEGLSTTDLPDAQIYLFRESKFDTSHVYVAGSTLANSSQQLAVAGLAQDKLSYQFTDTEGNLAFFEKYDDYGALYEYDVQERIVSGQNDDGYETEIQPYIMKGATINFNLTNTYRRDTNQRKIEIVKKWKGVESTQLSGSCPAAKFYIYRAEYAESVLDAATGFPQIDTLPALYDNRTDAVQKGGAYKVGEQTISYDLTKPDGEGTIGAWKYFNNGSADGSTWPVYAPDGKVYVYFICEDMNFSPAYTSNPEDLNSNVIKKLQSETSNYTAYVISNNGLRPDQSADAAGNTLTAAIVNTYNSGDDYQLIALSGTKSWVENETAKDGSYRPQITPDGTCSDIILTVTRTADSQTGQGNQLSASDGKGDLYKEYKYPADAIKVVWKQGTTFGSTDWTYTITTANGEGFPQYAPNGNPFIYTIIETLQSGTVTADNYSITDGKAQQKADTNVTVTDGKKTLNMGNDKIVNSLSGKITVIKEWKDNYDQYSIRENAVQVQLWRKTSDGHWEQKPVAEGIINKDTSYRWSISNLPYRSPEGKDYIYAVIETAMQKTTGDGTKEYDKIYADDAAVRKALTDGGKTQQFGSYLVTNPGNITDLSMTKKETTVKVINTLNQVVHLRVTKQWSGDNTEYGTRPKSVKVAFLYRSVNDQDNTINEDTDRENGWNYLRDSQNAIVIRTLEDDGNYSADFKNLPAQKRYSDGPKDIEYRAVEIDGHPGYEVAYKDDSQDVDSVKTYHTEITNTQTSHAKITVKKVRPAGETSSVQIQIYSDNLESGEGNQIPSSADLKPVGNPKTLATQTDGSLGLEITDLPKFNQNGKVIHYYVREVMATNDSMYPLYYKTTDGKVTSTEPDVQGRDAYCPVSDTEETLYIVNIPVIQATVEKIWDFGGNGDPYLTQPDAVNVTLQRQKENEGFIDVTADTKSVTVSLTGKGDWKAVVSNLPAYYVASVGADGAPELKAYTYRFTETGMTYGGETVAAVAENGSKECGSFVGTEKTTQDNADFKTTITNTLQTKSLTITKKWLGDKAEIRPDNISVVLNFQNNGKTTNCYQQNNALTIRGRQADTEWTATIDRLPAKDIYGKDLIYKLTENIVPGYQKTGELSVTAGASAGQNAQINIENQSIHLTIRKTDEQNPLPGATFTLTDQAESGTHFYHVSGNARVQEYVMDQGTLEIMGQLIPGHSYVLEEKEAPAGYVTMTGKLATIQVDADGKLTVTNHALAADVVASLDANNHLTITVPDKKTQISIQKVTTWNGETVKKPLAGATLRLTSADNSYTREWTTDTTGAILFDEGELQEGVVYRLEEMEVPKTSRGDSIYQTADVIYFRLQGVDADKYTACNSQIIICDKTGKELTDSKVTVTYTEETVGRQICRLEMADADAYKVYVQLRKYDTGIYDYELTQGTDTSGRTAEVLPDTVFALYKKNGDSWEKVKECYTNENGYLRDQDQNAEKTDAIQITERGTYKLVEEKRNGYIYGNGTVPYESAEFTVDEDDCGRILSPDGQNATEDNIRVENHRSSGALTISKIDKDTNEGLQGTQFALYYKSKTDNPFTQLFHAVTGNKYNYYELQNSVPAASGQELTIENLPWGSYYLVETEAIPGYRISVSDAQEAIHYAFEISAENVDQPIVLTAGDNTITNEKTMFRFLKYGYSKENPQDKDRAVEITGGSGSNTGTFQIFRAEDDAVCEFYTAPDSQTKVDTFTAGDSVYGLPGGDPGTNGIKYYIREIVPPDGYELSTQRIYFTMDCYGQISDVSENAGNTDYVMTTGLNGTVKMYDVTIDVALYKTDKEHNRPGDRYLLSGAEFTITPKTGSSFSDGSMAAKAFTSDAAGMCDLNRKFKTNSTYLLQETTAPAGYVRNTNTYIITIGADGQVRVTAENGLEEPGVISVEDGCIYFADEREYVNLEVQKVFSEFTQGNPYADSFRNTFRPDSIEVVLYKNHAGEANGTAVGDAVTLSAANGWKDADSWKRLPTYDIVKENDGTYRAIKNRYSLTENGVVQQYFYDYTTTVDEARTADGIWQLTLTNTLKDTFRQLGTLKIEKVNNGGPQEELFSMKVALSAKVGDTEYSLGDYRGDYEVYNADGTLAEKKNVLATNGYVQLQGNQYAQLSLPAGIQYSVQEILTREEDTDSREYEVTYKWNGTQTGKMEANGQTVDGALPGGTVTASRTDTVSVTNDAVIYTEIENGTLVTNRDNQNVAVGGTVSIINGQDTVQDVEKVDFRKNTLTVAWAPKEYWRNGNEFTLTYQEHAKDAKDAAKTITVRNYLQEDGTPITDTDAECYRELKARYENFTIRMTDGIIYLELNQSIQGIPFKNSVNVKFLPTIAVENTTKGNVGGTVQVEGGVANAASDGVEQQDGNARYVQNAVIATAEKGYIIDWKNMTVGTVGSASGDVGENTGAKVLSPDSSNRFRVWVEQEPAQSGITRMLRSLLTTQPAIAIDGKVEVLAANSYGEPTKVRIVVDGAGGTSKIPLDFGISFIKEPDHPKDSGGSGTSHRTNPSGDTQSVASTADLYDPKKSGKGEQGTVNTGDDSTLWNTLFGISLMGLLGMLIHKMRSKKDERQS